MAAFRGVRVAAACAWAAASAAALASLAVALLADGGSPRSHPAPATPARAVDEQRPDPDAISSEDASAVPDLIDLDDLIDAEEVPDELPADLFMPDDDALDIVGVSDAAEQTLTLDGVVPYEASMPPLLTQDVPLADFCDHAGLAAPLSPAARCLLAGLATVRGESMPADLALALARAAMELTGAPASPASALAASRAATERLGTLGLAHAPIPGRIALTPAARDAGVELLAALPPIAVEHLGDAALRWWVERALVAGIPSEDAALSGALLWAREHERQRALLELVHVLAPGFATGSLDGVDERTCYEWAREAATALGDGEGQLWATHQLARVLLDAGATEEARAHLDYALALSARLGRDAERREELHALALLDAREGDGNRAWTRHQEALSLAQRLGDSLGQREELHSLAVLDAQGGRVADARTGFQIALDLASATGDLAAERAERHALAVLDARAGQLAQARNGFHAALELARRLGDRRGERAELHELAAVDARAGHVEAARTGFEAALLLARELGDTAAESSELQALGFRDLNMGRLREARSELHEALALARQTAQPLLMARALWSCAELDARLNFVDDARARFLEALALYERLGDPDAHNAYIRLRLRELGLAD